MIPAHFPDDPRPLWEQFYHITQIPRPSKKEELFREYILSLAKQHNLEAKVDTAGNVVVYVPGTSGKENNEPVIIQNHMDMVTDHAPGVIIDFNKDPITTLVDSGWLKAKGTTLGADNGVGCAAALACITDPNIEHPPLELLFTTDEETGLNGAWGVEADYFKGRRMINLDTEEWGSLYIGCAGGIDYEINGQFPAVNPNFSNCFRIDIQGLCGGHSGIDIHLGRGNAVKLMQAFLVDLKQEVDFEIAELRSGRAHNIIPRESFAILYTDMPEDKLKQSLDDFIVRQKTYLNKEDQHLTGSVQKSDEGEQKVLDLKNTEKFLDYLTLFPHGAHSFDLEAEELLTATSNNMAVVLLKNGIVYTLTSLRFFDREEVTVIEKQLKALAHNFDFSIKKESEYPSWKPARKSDLLTLVANVYEKEFKTRPEIKAIHAGLECGILRDRIGEVDVISFGPTIMGAHSPDERIKIDTVGSFWRLFVQVLKEL